MSAGYETYDAELPDGTSCSDTVYDTATYTLADKIAAITVAADTDGNGAINGDVETAEYVRLADIAWDKGGEDGANPLTNADGRAVTTDTGAATSGRTYTFAHPAPACPRSNNCNPETLQFGATMGFGAFTIGGGWMQRNVTDNASYTAMDFGVSWPDGPMNLGAVYAQSETENTGMSDASTKRFARNGTHVLEPGVDIQAEIDFGEHDAAGLANSAMDNDWVQLTVDTSIGF